MMPKTKVTICPYCGETQPAQDRCRGCGGFFDALSRQATHNAMGPWWIRAPERPFQPGCSYETMIRLIDRGQVTKYSIIRGPTTKQFWTVARHVPGIAHLLGFCHACDTTVDPDDHGCPNCGVPFGAYLDRNYLGLPEVRALPGEAPAPDDEHSGRPAGRPSWTMPAMSPRGLSSFAADEELLGDHDPAGGSFSAAGGESAPAAAEAYRPSSASATAARAAKPEPETERSSDAALEARALRVLQRRVAKQQRTIRILTAVVIAVALIAAFVNLAIFSAMNRDQANPATNPPAMVDRDSPAAEDEAVAPATADDDDAESGANEPAPTEPAADESDAGTTSPAANDEVDDRIESARVFMTEGADTSRAVDVRLKRYREALAILQAIEQPDDEVNAMIESIEEEIEELELRTFFPK